MKNHETEKNPAVGRSDSNDGLATVEVGKIYLVNSQRKGTFMARMTRVDDMWATGIITGGYARAMLDYNERDTGEEVTMRRSLCRFTEQAANVELRGRAL